MSQGQKIKVQGSLLTEWFGRGPRSWFCKAGDDRGLISFRARGRPSPFGPIRDVLRQGSGLRTRVGKDVGPGAQDDGRRRVLPHNSHTAYIKLRPRPSRFSNFLSPPSRHCMSLP